MKWTIQELHKLQYESLTFDESIDLSAQLQQADQDIRDASPIRVEGRADIDSHKASFHLHITGTLILPCSRTLADVEYPVDIHSTETYLLKEYDMEDVEDAETYVHHVHGGIIDLEPVVYELLLLEVPMQVVSPKATDASSLPAGQDWEVLTEDQFLKAKAREKEKVDPRLADLAKLLDNKEDEEDQ